MISRERANQDRAMRGGTMASGGSTCSTASSKREPDSETAGSDTTIPVTPRSTPSQTCGSSCSSRTVARQVASDAPPTANAQTTTTSRTNRETVPDDSRMLRSGKSSRTENSASHRASGSDGKNCTISVPAANPTIARHGFTHAHSCSRDGWRAKSWQTDAQATNRPFG